MDVQAVVDAIVVQDALDVAHVDLDVLENAEALVHMVVELVQVVVDRHAQGVMVVVERDVGGIARELVGKDVVLDVL